MRVVIDGLPVRGGSLALVVEQLLRGWRDLGTADELHLLLGPAADVDPGPGVHIKRIDVGPSSIAGRLWHQNVAIRSHCRDTNADVMLGSLPATAVVPLPCPRAVIAHDLRHEMRKQQFSRRFRMKRMISYGAGFRQADAIVCISPGTRDDLLASRPWLDPDRVRVALLGADHVLAWPPATPSLEPYAIAFGQYGNKNVPLLLEAWRLLVAEGKRVPLKIVGLRPTRIEAAQDLVARNGLTGVVTLFGWLPNQEFQQVFASAGLVVFPSDFEGFGVPAVEAMRLGIPLVITPERTLLQVTGRLATVTDGWSPREIAHGVERALPLMSAPPDPQITQWAEAFTWRRTASDVRSLLMDVAGTGNRSVRRRRAIPGRA